MSIKEEIPHAIALLVFSVAIAIGYLALRSGDAQLLGWPLALGLFVAGAWVSSFFLWFHAKRSVRSDPQGAITSFELTFLRWVIPGGAVLAIPLVVAAEFPTDWSGTEDSAQVMRVVVAFVVIEVIKLLALDGKWIVERMAVSARTLVRRAFEDDELEKLTPRWHAVRDDAWQNGWGKRARAKRAEALSL